MNFKEYLEEKKNRPQKGIVGFDDKTKKHVIIDEKSKEEYVIDPSEEEFMDSDQYGNKVWYVLTPKGAMITDYQ